MKELSIEEKARRYDGAIKRLENIETGKCQKTFMFTEGLFDYIFPELKESEDERIRKAILELVKQSSEILGKKNQEQMIAWIEKQAQKPNPCDGCINRKGCINCENGELRETEQEPAKTEPKFKVGDWVVRNGETLQISGIDTVLDGTFHYWFTKGTWLSSKKMENAMLWTIQDAKDGDVVVDKSDGTVGIFQSIGHHPDGGSCNDPSYCFLHCRYDDGFFYADFEHGNTIDSVDLIPATKEQCDLLFQNMREAGYEWDAEKKELKRIEQKAWSEEDEKMLKTAITSCEQCGNEYAYYWLKSLKDRVQPQPKQEWSEEDDRMCKAIIDNIKAICEEGYFVGDIGSDKLINWLNSLRFQKQWKPSDEQMRVLGDINLTGGISYAGQGQELINLYNDLKKLKG